MPHQRSFRLGWQSQNLARYILYKFSFLAEPVQVADDIGVDFFCTLFEIKARRTNADLIPRNSFAIQIKSETDANNINLTGYLPYLIDIELPFFIGVVDRINSALSIYSGELLTPFFAYKGTPTRLEAELCETLALGPDYSGWNKELSPGNYVIPFPKLAEITSGMDDDELEVRVRAIREKCSSMLDNIASRINKEFILKGAAPDHLLLFAGPESLQFFEINFIERLSEAFFNLNWAYSSLEQLRPQILERFRLYEKIYEQLASTLGEGALPRLLRETYKGAKDRIEGS